MIATLKSTSREQVRGGDEPCGGSLSANLRIDGQKSHRRPSLRVSRPSTTKPAGGGDGVNAAMVWRQIVFLPGEIYLPKPFNDGGGTEPAKVRVNRVEVSRGRESGVRPGERSEGSVIGRCL